jgi:hypothetical protein
MSYAHSMGSYMSALERGDINEAGRELANAQKILNGEDAELIYGAGVRDIITDVSSWFIDLFTPKSKDKSANESLSHLKDSATVAPLDKIPELESSETLISTPNYSLSSDGVLSLAQLEYDNNQKYIYKDGVKGIPMHEIGDGKYTYGYGHAVDSITNAPPQADANGWMSIEDAYKLLAEDSIRYANEVVRILSNSRIGGDLSGLQLKQNEIDVLIMICYNRPATIYALKPELSKDRSEWSYQSFFDTIMNDYPPNPRYRIGWENRTKAQLDLFFK